jgi:hypothetical protein
LLPALALMRTSRASTHRQGGIEHQYACLCPCGEVPCNRGGKHSIRTCATCRPKEEGGREAIVRKRKVKRGRSEVVGIKELTHPCFGGTKSSYSALISL